MIPWQASVVFAVAALWFVIEGSTIVICANAFLRGGAGRLDRLGFRFLATEAWTLVMLGLLHGVMPVLVHDVFGAAPWAPITFVVGWMLRDLGLWLGRTHAWRIAVSVGALLQVVGGLGLGVQLVMRLVRDSSIEVAIGSTLLAAATIPALMIGVVCQVWLVMLQRRRVRACPPST